MLEVRTTDESDMCDIGGKITCLTRFYEVDGVLGKMVELRFFLNDYHIVTCDVTEKRFLQMFGVDADDEYYAETHL